MLQSHLPDWAERQNETGRNAAEVSKTSFNRRTRLLGTKRDAVIRVARVNGVSGFKQTLFALSAMFLFSENLPLLLWRLADAIRHVMPLARSSFNVNHAEGVVFSFLSRNLDLGWVIPFFISGHMRSSVAVVVVYNVLACCRHEEKSVITTKRIFGDTPDICWMMICRSLTHAT